VLDEALRGIGVAAFEPREQCLGLFTEMVEIGTSGKVVSHRASMHTPEVRNQAA
jgi:hypothetical protein